MDALSFRLANRLVGNGEEVGRTWNTVSGPALRFTCDTSIALAGADFGARLDGAALRRGKA